MVRRIHGMMVALVLACLNPAELYGCPISLRIENHSAFYIEGVKFRRSGSGSWEHKSPSTVENYYEILQWSDPLDSVGYDIAVQSSNAPANPQCRHICDICKVSKIIINDDNNIMIQGNCSDDNRCD
jgi:hypothetical protein